MPKRPKSKQRKLETLTKWTFSADAVGKTRIAVKLTKAIRKRACALKSLRAKLVITTGGPGRLC